MPKRPPVHRSQITRLLQQDRNKKRNESKRIRGRANQTMREALKRRNPLCGLCLAENRYTEGVEIDHRIPLHLGGLEDSTNVWLLCAACHKKKTLWERTHKRPMPLPDLPEVDEKDRYVIA